MKRGEDRAIDVSEIKQLLKYVDPRGKALILLMASSGIRVGAIGELRVKHLRPILEDNKIITASLTVYPGDKEQYNTFTTPEAYKAIHEYLEYRKRSGEDMDDSSPLFRDKFRSNSSKVKPLGRDGIRSIIHRLLKQAGIRNGEKKKRFEFQADHGFRKFFKTRAEQVMKPIHVEMLMGHSTGLSGRYYKPQGERVCPRLQEGSTVIDNLKPGSRSE